MADRGSGVGARAAAAVAVGALVSFAQPPASDWPGAGRAYVATPAVFTLAEGAPTPESPAEAVPPGVAVDLLTMAAEGDGLRAEVRFADGFARVRELGGRSVEETVALLLVPPSGPRMRVVLRPDDSGRVEREVPGGFEAVDRVEPVVGRMSVTLPVPPGIGVRADWEAQAVVEVRDDDGNGLWAATPPVPVGALTGQRATGAVPAARHGVRVRQGAPVPALPADLPDSSRPVGLEVANVGGRVRATVRLAAAPERVETYEGRPVVTHVLALQVAASFGKARVPLVYSFDFLTSRARLFDASRPNPDVGEIGVSVEGASVVFDVGPAPPNPDAVPFAAGFRATMTVLDGSNDGVAMETAYADAATLLTRPPEPPEPAGPPPPTTALPAGERTDEVSSPGGDGGDGQDEANRTGTASRVAIAVVALAAGAVLVRRRMRAADEAAVAEAERRRR